MVETTNQNLLPGLKIAALIYAKNKATPVDMVNAMLELLIKKRTKQPPLSTLERMAFTAPPKTNDNLCSANLMTRIEHTSIDRRDVTHRVLELK